MSLAPAAPPTPVPQILRRPDVQAQTGLSKTGLYALIGEGTFPRPVQLGPRRVGWHAAEVAEWIASRPRAGAPELS